MSTEKKPGSKQIYCLNGMRFLSMTWVMICHFAMDMPYLLGWTITPFFVSFQRPLFKYTQRIYLQPARYTMEVIYNGYVSVDSFFFMGGCLLACISFKEMDAMLKRGNGKIGGKMWAQFWTMYYVQRYIRLTITYAFIIGLLVTYGKLFRGTLEDPIMNMVEACEEQWYWNLLYVNNFWNDNGNLCLNQSWYLSTDMQLYVFSPLILYPLWRIRGKFRKAVLCLFWTVLALVIPFAVTIAKDFPIHYRSTTESIEGDFFKWFYHAPWMRLTTYLPGIFTGLLLHETRGVKIKGLNWPTALIGWMAAFATGLAVVYGVNFTSVFNSTAEEKTTIENAFYNSFGKMSWAVCLAWIVFVSEKGFGGVINSILSWSAFMPLAKLCYIAFLVHLPMTRLVFTFLTYDPHIDYFLLVVWGLTFIVAVMFVSLFIYLLIELPFGMLQKHIFTPRKKDK